MRSGASPGLCDRRLTRSRSRKIINMELRVTLQDDRRHAHPVDPRARYYTHIAQQPSSLRVKRSAFSASQNLSNKKILLCTIKAKSAPPWASLPSRRSPVGPAAGARRTSVRRRACKIRLRGIVRDSQCSWYEKLTQAFGRAPPSQLPEPIKPQSHQSAHLEEEAAAVRTFIPRFCRQITPKETESRRRISFPR